MKKVLLVDDSDVARIQMKDAFADSDYEIVEAGGGQQAIDILRLNPDVAMVILDYNMPEMDGLELGKKLREINQNVSLIFVSAQGSTELKKVAKELGAVCWAMKPVASDALVNIVKRFAG